MRDLPRELSAEELAELFEGRTRFVERLALELDPLTRARTLVHELPAEEKREVLDAHPAIGQRAGLSARSAAEQGTDDDPDVARRAGPAERRLRGAARLPLRRLRRPAPEGTRSSSCSARASTTPPTWSSRPRWASSSRSPRTAGDADELPPRALGRTFGLGRSRAALAARDRRDGLDRHVVLLRPPRPVAPAAEGRRRPRRRSGGRALGGARRRLLPGAEVRRRAAAAARPRRVVQVGGLRDVALGLRAPARPLLPRCLERARPAGRRSPAVARSDDLDRNARRAPGSPTTSSTASSPTRASSGRCSSRSWRSRPGARPSSSRRAPPGSRSAR